MTLILLSRSYHLFLYSQSQFLFVEHTHTLSLSLPPSLSFFLSLSLSLSLYLSFIYLSYLSLVSTTPSYDTYCFSYFALYPRTSQIQRTAKQSFLHRLSMPWTSSIERLKSCIFNVPFFLSCFVDFFFLVYLYCVCLGIYIILYT